MPQSTQSAAHIREIAMFDLEFARRALALAALALFLTPVEALGLSPRARRFCRRAAIWLLAIAMTVALGATLVWLVTGGEPAATRFDR
jgi:hypothetical protein